MMENNLNTISEELEVKEIIEKKKSSWPIFIFIGLVVLIAIVLYASILRYGTGEIFEALRMDFSNGEFPESLKRFEEDYLIRNYIHGRVSELIAAFAIVSALIVGLFALFLNYEKIKDIPVIKKFNKLSIEIRYGLIPLLIWLVSLIIIFVFSELLSGYNVDFIIEEIITRPYETGLYPIVVTAISFPILLYLFLAIFSIKEVFKEGIINTFFSKSLFGKFILCANTYVRRFFSSVSSFGIVNSLMFAGFYSLFLLAIIYSRNSIILLAGILGLFITLILHRQIRGIKKLEEDALEIQTGNYSKEINTNVSSLYRLAESLNQVSEGLENAVAKEIQSQRTKTELITNVSHDLKTPLTGIINYSDLLTKEDLTEESRIEYAGVVHEKALRLKTLIEDLFEISKTQSGDVELHFEKLNIIELFYQSLGEMEERLSEKNLNLIVNVPEEKMYSLLDGRKTYRIFENVLSNISKYSLQGTRVYIDSSIEKNNISFVFKNISDYEMNFKAEELFERSFRGDKARSSEGSGLGLGIARNLIELQGGDMDITIDGDLFKLSLLFPLLNEE